MVERKKSSKRQGQAGPARRTGGAQGFDGKRPNILVFLVDELRVPPRYETEGHPHHVEWRRSDLRAQEL